MELERFSGGQKEEGGGEGEEGGRGFYFKVLCIWRCKEQVIIVTGK